MILDRLSNLWATLFRKETIARELDEELQSAIATLTARYESAGMERTAARHAAIAAVCGPGGVIGVKEEVLDGRVGAALDAVLLDLRYAWRGIRKSRTFTAVVVVTLALGIGANTAIFSVVHAMLIEPLPFRDADRLAFIWLDRTQTGYPRGPMSGPDLRDLRTGTKTFAAFGGIWASGAIALSGDGEPEQLRSALVTTNFFDVLGAEPALGRTFRSEDSAHGAEPTILIGWDLFQRRFGGDAAIVGRKIHIDDRLVTVIGVMPQPFRLLLPSDASVPDHLQAWIPFWPDLVNGPRRNLFLRVVGRMRPGVTIAQARDDIAALGRRISAELGTARTFTTVALQDDDVREIRGPLLALFAGVGILLMIACVNVANLLVARASTRGRELAVRLALGASRGRILRQSLVEGLTLTMLGAAAGIATGYAGLRLLLALSPTTLNRLQTARISPSVFAFTLGISIVWGVLFSLAPMAEVLGAEPAGALGVRRLASIIRRPRGAGYRTRAGLLVVQVALSVVLLVGAGLLVRAFMAVLRVDPGFKPEGLLTFRLAVPNRIESREAFNAFGDELHRRIGAVRGITGVGTISHLPYDDLPNWALPFSPTRPLAPDAPYADARAISAGLFDTLGLTLVEGRRFTEDDLRAVTIIDEMLAKQLWPNVSAVGRVFYSRAGGDGTPIEVIGVVRHARVRSLVDNLSPQMFVPWHVVLRNPTAFVVRSDRDAASLMPEIRAAIASVDPRLPIYDIRPMMAYVEDARAARRFTMTLAAAFAGTALLLACVGVYGVLAYVVSHRRHEFGVRRALGADAGQVLRHVLREGIGFTMVGIGIGIVGAALAGQLLQSQLYGVHPRDPMAFGAAVALIATGALIACWIPAHRATIVSPMDALRTE